jgi:hypothetical protein
VYAKVSAINQVGESEYSTPGNGAVITMSYTPDAPVNLAKDFALTSKSQISLVWEDGSSNGGQPILDYRVSHDQAAGIWTVLSSSVTERKITLSGTTSGQTYYFKVEARNVIGYSPESVTVGIKAAIVPTAPTSVTTTRDVNDVVINWTPPSVNSLIDFGDAILGYRVYIRTSDSNLYEQDVSECPDTGPSTHTCSVSINTLQDYPFHLAEGNSVWAKVVAFNSIGEGAESIPGNGASISTIVVPDAPINLQFNPA